MAHGSASRYNLIDQRISPYLRQAHAMLLDVANIKAGSSTLVMECRDGWAAEEAWRRAGGGRCRVVGVDVSPDMIELAIQYREVPGRLEFRTWDGSTLAFDDGTFDTVISTFNMHRYAEPRRVISEANRVLARSGNFFVLEPLKYSFAGLYLLVDWYYRVRDAGHVRYYSRRQLSTMLRDAGFGVVSSVWRLHGFSKGGKLLANAVLLNAHKDYPEP